MKLGVVITCHAAYLSLLPDAVAGWEAMREDLVAAVVVYDGCEEEVLPVLPEGWAVLHVLAGTPNPGRNLGLLKAEAMGAEWVVFWDADNVPPAGYATALQGLGEPGQDVGVVAPFVTKQGSEEVLNEPMGHPAETWCLDTASCWRVEAVRQAGGWPLRGVAMDDWTLCLRLHAAGWKVRGLPEVTVVCSRHELGHRHAQTIERGTEALWRARPVTVVVLLAGRRHLVPRFLAAMRAMVLPPVVSLVVSIRREDADLEAVILAGVGEERFRRITILRASGEECLEPAGKLTGWAEFGRVHRLVGRLYSEAVDCTQDPVVLMWEDDVFPERPDAVRLLSDELRPKRRLAAVAGVYPSRSNPETAVASLDGKLWRNMPKIAGLPRGPMKVGMVAAGLTLWSREALRQCPPRAPDLREGRRLGWDGDICRRLGERGWGFILHGDVRCAHETQPVTLMSHV